MCSILFVHFKSYRRRKREKHSSLVHNPRKYIRIIHGDIYAYKEREKRFLYRFHCRPAGTWSGVARVFHVQKRIPQRRGFKRFSLSFKNQQSSFFYQVLDKRQVKVNVRKKTIAFLSYRIIIKEGPKTFVHYIAKANWVVQRFSWISIRKKKKKKKENNKEKGERATYRLTGEFLETLYGCAKCNSHFPHDYSMFIN